MGPGHIFHDSFITHQADIFFSPITLLLHPSFSWFQSEEGEMRLMITSTFQEISARVVFVGSVEGSP